MLYEISSTQYSEINNAIPPQHEFGYYDAEKNQYFFDDTVVNLYDFDLDSTFQSLYTLNFSEFLDSLPKKGITNLKILRYIHPDEEVVEIQDIDFTTLSLIKASPMYIQGRKQSASYFADESQLDLVIKKTFYDRIENDLFIGLDIKIEWYDENNEVALIKNVFKPLNRAEAYYTERKRRQSALDYLIANSVQTPLGEVISDILERYKDEIDIWLKSGSDDFAQRIIHESGQPWKGYLDYVDNDGQEDLFPDGFTVREIILFQIGYAAAPGYE